MIELIQGDIFESKCQALVNPVNCVGVSGAGLAFQFKKRFPKMFTEYHQNCKDGLLVIGRLHCWENPEPPPKWIINFPTKEHYRNPSKIEYIETGLDALETYINIKGIPSIAIPAIGCGLGNLKFDTVLALLRGFHAKLKDVNVEVFYPS